MSTYQNKVVISDPERFQQTIQAMIAADRLADFATTFTRLFSLLTNYLAADTAPDRQRTATLWADSHDAHDFYWLISEADTRPPGDNRTTILAGGLHYHAAERTWSINT